LATSDRTETGREIMNSDYEQWVYGTLTCHNVLRALKGYSDTDAIPFELNNFYRSTVLGTYNWSPQTVGEFRELLSKPRDVGWEVIVRYQEGKQ
jgi:hypothetical protein